MNLLQKTKYLSFLTIVLFNLIAEAKISEFNYDGKTIHPACLSLLATQLNGDNLVSRVNLDKVNLRGCVTSNYAVDEIREEEGTIHSKISRDGEQTLVSYQVLKNLGNKAFIVQYDEEVKGSMGNSREIMIIKLAPFKTITANDKGVKLHQSVGLVKLGQVENVKALENREIINNINKNIK